MSGNSELELLGIPREVGSYDNKSVNLYRLCDKISSPEGARDMQRRGFFKGDKEKDSQLLKLIPAVTADDAKFLPTLLDAVWISRGIATLNLGPTYPNLSLRGIEERIRKGEILDPYPVQGIEDVLTASLMPEIPSITLMEAELRIRPDWWNEFSPYFRKNVLSKYIRILNTSR